MTKEDTNLIKFVHKETYRGFEISASLSRYGNLFVTVSIPDTYDALNYSDNVLKARDFIDKKIEDMDAQADYLQNLLDNHPAILY